MIEVDDDNDKTGRTATRNKFDQHTSHNRSNLNLHNDFSTNSNAVDDGTKSEEDSGPPIIYPKVENFKRMKLDLDLDVRSSGRYGK